MQQNELRCRLIENFNGGKDVSTWLRLGRRLAAVTMLAAIRLAAQHSDHQAPGPGARSQEVLDRPIALRPGIGHAHQKVSTTSTRAQTLYDQGLAYLHSYVWVESIRSFRQALRFDRDLGMAYVGMADAFIGMQQVTEARSACNKAAALKSHMSDSEHKWLSIRDAEVAYLESGNDQAKYTIYRDALKQAVDASPRDPWLWVQSGLATEASPLTHGQASGSESLAFYKKALTLDANNIAAVHYTVHANENLGQTKEALEGSAIYVRMASSIPHAHHMHGHELMRMGRSEDAIEEFLKARSLEETAHSTEQIPAGLDWHYAHNLQLLALNYELLGEVKSAESLLRQAFSLPASTEFLDYNRKAWPEFLINRGRHEEALEAAQELARSASALPRMAGHSLIGEALLGLNRLDEAQQELDRAEQEVALIPARVGAALPYPAALRAALLLRHAQKRQGEDLFAEVERSTMAMPGPDAWIAAIFTLDSIAREAREAGDWELAGYTAQQMILHDPYFAGGHFALGLCAEHEGELAGSIPMFTQAEKLWNHADADLPDLLITREKLAASH